MIDVSQEYLDEIYDDNTRTVCTVSYGAFDMTAKGKASVASNGKQSFSSEAETLDSIIETQKYATLEKDYWLLDGNILNFPVDTFNKIWGYWSNALSNSEGKFSTNPTLTYTWSENHSSIGIRISAMETIKEMKLYWYDSSNTLISEYTFTNSDESKIDFDIENQVANYQKLVVEFVEILPYHYVKIQEIFFGIEVALANEIIEITVSEGLDEKQQTLPSNEAIIKLNNIDNTFNKYNPNGMLQFLQEGQRLTIYAQSILSTKRETVLLGNFYLKSWGSSSEYTTELKANDLIMKLTENYYYSPFYTDAKVKTIIDDLFAMYGSEIQYIVDNNVKDVTLTGYIPIVSVREALQQICFACGAVAKVNRYGQIVIKRLTNDQAVDTIDYSKKAFAMDKEADRYSSVTITQYDYSVATNATELFRGSVTGNQILVFSKPATNISVSGTYTSYTAYANCVAITGASGEIVVTGKEYQTYEKKYTAFIGEDREVGITKQNMPVEGICLIGKEATATYLATWLLTMLQMYITNEFRWLCNPAIEIGDYVNVQVADDITKKAMIHKNKFTYNGALSETSEVVM